LAGRDPIRHLEDAGGVRPGRIAWFSIFASGLVVGLIVGLGLSPQGYAGAARQFGQISGLWAAPADRPMTPAAAPLLSAPPVATNGDDVSTAPSAPPPTAVRDVQEAGPLYGAPTADADEADPPPYQPQLPLGQPQPSPTPISTPAIPAAPLGAHPLTVGVFGDSLADGLWAGLYRQVRDGKRLDVVKFSQPSTGLSRYDYVNVQQKTEGQLAKRHVDVAVVMFGTNDQQGIVEGGKVLAFGTPDWRQAYGARVDALVTLLRRQGAAVYWVGLPKMRSEGFDHKAQLINGVIQQHMAALGVRFIPTDGATEDTHGAYAAYLPGGASGKMTLMRANDGIHMSMPGYLRIAEPIAASIRADLSRRAGPAVSAAVGLR